MSETATQEVVTEPVAPPAPMPGAILEEERRRQSLSVTDVARQLKLAPRQVEALERDDYGALPGPVFVRGFMRNYARMLGLDAEPLVRVAEGILSPGKTDASVDPGPVPRPGQIANAVISDASNGGGRSRMPLYVASAVIVLVVGYLATRDRTPPLAPMDVPVAPAPAEPPVVGSPPASSVAPTPEAPGAVAPAPAAGPAPVTPASPSATVPTPATAGASPAASTPVPVNAEGSPGAAATATTSGADEQAVGRNGPEIRLKFDQESWVEVRDGNDRLIFAQLNPEGSVRIVRGKPPLSLVVGNAAGVTLSYKGKAVDLAPHTRVSVARLTLE